MVSANTIMDRSSANTDQSPYGMPLPPPGLQHRLGSPASASPTIASPSSPASQSFLSSAEAYPYQPTSIDNETDDMVVARLIQLSRGLLHELYASNLKGVLWQENTVPDFNFMFDWQVAQS
jgi:hypothetical protein